MHLVVFLMDYPFLEITKVQVGARVMEIKRKIMR